MFVKDLDWTRFVLIFFPPQHFITDRFLLVLQPEFFGLRYVSQNSYPRVRWVELDRPLKKQLDKHAQEAYLYLRIMYYVSDVSLLQDEMTR